MSKGKNWVDFSEIKSTVTIEMVLSRYGVLEGLKKSGNNLAGCCPIHKGTNSRQFSVNPEKNIFKCFSGDCNAGGNILDFVSKMEDVSIRKAGLLLKEWFLGDLSSEKEREPPEEPETSDSEQGDTPEKIEERDSRQDGVTQEVGIINPPLAFKLKSLEYAHPFFDEREISQETISYFGLGFCKKGMMKDRIVVPIHNEGGILVAYCGRAVSGEQIEAEGKYKMPPKFVKSAVVYNLNRQREDENTLILVESFLSVFKIHQAGFYNVVALMGSSLSEEQENLIACKLGGKGLILTFFDADESGQQCTEDCLKRFSRHLFVKMLDVSIYAKKPHLLNPDEIKRLIVG